MSCEECHATLDYALSENGLSYELDHYSTLELEVPLRSGDAYAIARMVAALGNLKKDGDDLADELSSLDLEDDDDRERAAEIRQEMAEREPSVRAQVLAIATRALAAASPAPAAAHSL